MTSTFSDNLPDQVAIIMAAYNAVDTLERSVQSIQGQTYPYWTLWVVDDGSKDDTAALISRLAAKDGRIRLLQQPNGGTAAARNNGLSHANGQWIAFLDADDRWLPTYLETALQTLRHNPPGLAYSWYYAVDEHDNLVTLSPAYQVTGVAFNDVLTRESLLLPSTTVMHADVLNTAPGFLTQHIHEDREYYLRVCQQFPIYPMGQRLVLYQQTAQGKCRALLKDYNRAVHAEMSIVDSVAHLLSADALHELTQSQKRNLFYRFLMYNFMAEARTLWGDGSVKPLLGDKKGVLAVLSLKTGVSWLFLARLLIQKVILWTIQPWWKNTLKRRMQSQKP
jgi:glycosyltransferase involved in cell wall biosynthesis